jgi:hypothetical protein
MADGINCKCFASSEANCVCGADWTPSEVYELRREIQGLKQENSDLRKSLGNIFSCSYNEMERWRDDG